MGENGTLFVAHPQYLKTTRKALPIPRTDAFFRNSNFQISLYNLRYYNKIILTFYSLYCCNSSRKHQPTMN